MEKAEQSLREPRVTLGRKQEIFTYCLAKLLLHMSDKYSWDGRLREVMRSKEQAEIYAEQGRGILNSNHRNSLAADIYWSKNGVLQWDGETYDKAAEYWKTFSDGELEFCWGGDFRRRDVYHYSIKHNGVM